MLTGNAIIGQSGGPTSVINASLAGVINAVKGFDGIERALGMRFGIEGFMADNVIDLDKESGQVIEGLKTTPSSGGFAGDSGYAQEEEHTVRFPDWRQ